MMMKTIRVLMLAVLVLGIASAGLGCEAHGKVGNTSAGGAVG